MRSARLVAIVAIIIVAILALTYVTRDGDDGSLVILHSNDTHCHYDEGLGLSTLKALKDSMKSKGDTVFVVDAGDFLQGATYGTITQGRSSVDVMNSVGYDVGIPGNHEFDFGFPVLLERASALNYPLICANLSYPDGKSVFPEYVVLEKKGVKVGFFGLLTPDVAISVKAGSMGDAIVTDPVEAASRMVSLLRGMGVDKVVAIGHIGLESTTITSDRICDRVHGIDLFIDGHSHTAMENGKAEGFDLIPGDTVIASTGGHCTSFGIVKMNGGKTEASLYKGEPLRDAQVDEAVRKVREECSAVLGTSIATSEIFLDGEKNDVRTKDEHGGSGGRRDALVRRKRRVRDQFRHHPLQHPGGGDHPERRVRRAAFPGRSGNPGGRRAEAVRYDGIVLLPPRDGQRGIPSDFWNERDVRSVRRSRIQGRVYTRERLRN